MLNVLIDTAPLQNANAIRGVGIYTKLLREELQKNAEVHVVGEKNEPFDVIHYPYFDLFFPTLPLHRKTKTVVTIHDVIPLIFPKQYRPGKKGLFNFYRQKLALRSVDAVKIGRAHV